MATAPSSCSPSASNSENSATQLAAHTPPDHKVSPKDFAADNGVSDALKNITSSIDPYEDMNTDDYIQKFKKYEADYARRLMAKYFSEKDIYGGNIFDEKMTIDGELIRASRWPGTQSYKDPAQSFQYQNCSATTNTLDTSMSISNGKLPVKNEG